MRISFMHPMMMAPPVFALVFALAGCEETGPEIIDGVLLPDVEAATFVAAIDHPFFPAPAGATWALEGATAERQERRERTVLAETAQVNGITVVQVQERTLVDRGLTEEATLSFAQDEEGNVWQLAEATCSIEEGACLSTAGSWELGLTPGARPGHAMPAAPAVDGQKFFQAYAPGVVEDVNEVVEVGASITVGDTTFDDCVKIKESSSLRAGDETATWCRGAGLVHLTTPDGELSLVESTGL